MDKVKIGVIGCGNISSAYLSISKTFQILDVVACADLIMERAKTQAEKYDVPCACTPEELLNNPDIEIVLNLTTPEAHAAIGLAALEAGKSVYNEKPLTISFKDAQRMLALAREKGLRIGGAPDTFLGAGLPTCRRLIDDGVIGTPVAATAFMVCHGHESWHPDPEFYYQEGGGPMFDMGPYYLTALVSLLGSIRRVTGSTQISFPKRTITSEPKNGTVIDVEVPTHVVGVLDFTAGALGTIITSFDVWAHNLPRIEIYGSEGTLSVPDPNTFGGPVQVWKADTKVWEDVDLVPGYPENSRSLGLADMAHAMRTGRRHRANGMLTYHVLEVMHAIHDASRSGRHVMVQSPCKRPAPLPLDLPTGVLDD